MVFVLSRLLLKKFIKLVGLVVVIFTTTTSSWSLKPSLLQNRCDRGGWCCAATRNRPNWLVQGNTQDFSNCFHIVLSPGHPEVPQVWGPGGEIVMMWFVALALPYLRRWQCFGCNLSLKIVRCPIFSDFLLNPFWSVTYHLFIRL